MKAFITKITPWHPTRISIQWLLEEASESGTFTFAVERSGSPEGDWTVVATGLTDTTVYDDIGSSEDINTLSLSRDIYYRVKVTPPSGVTNNFYTPVVNLDGLVEHEIVGPDDGIGYKVNSMGQYEPPPLTGVHRRPKRRNTTVRLLKRKILRDEYTKWRKLSGIEFLILKRRHFGVRCTTCYDQFTREVLVSRCPICFGTSWVGGYFNPILILGQRLNSVVQTALSPQTKDTTNSTRIQTLDFPKIEEGDLLIEKAHNRRFLVQQRYATSLKTIDVHQTLTVSELERQAIEYNIPVNL